ncbi:hypothetical protein [Cupriavidus pinatubonensis]|uniref:Uncharacterized protein n=1 Tax=Cupriavidus pinatubonensis TaxID=248026 RepID=A0ABM8XAR5_9BURK|nr:hypothetical protein [Cupriavidus pinatubonensis]CAG9177122.1 hypothetical protein LMG23994_03584 [Cupriavidus pinatubonensis]
MHKDLAKTLLATVALVAGFSQTAHAGGYADALIVGAPSHNGPRDPYTDGARIGAHDPFTDGARIASRDPFTDGARISSRDGFTDGGHSDARGGGA